MKHNNRRKASALHLSALGMNRGRVGRRNKPSSYKLAGAGVTLVCLRHETTLNL